MRRSPAYAAMRLPLISKGKANCAFHKKLGHWMLVASRAGWTLLGLCSGCTVHDPMPVAHAPAAQTLWCKQSQGYYPAVQDCPGGWESRLSDAQPPAVSPPLRIIQVKPPAGTQQ